MFAQAIQAQGQGHRFGEVVDGLLLVGSIQLPQVDKVDAIVFPRMGTEGLPGGIGPCSDLHLR